jgi:hypothetical protein
MPTGNDQILYENKQVGKIAAASPAAARDPDHACPGSSGD